MRHVAVVGGSRGIGRATVMRFAQNGDRVLSTSRSGVHDKDFPPQVVSRAVNMAEVDAPARILDAIEQDLGRLDVLCLVAGVFPACPLSDMTPEALSEILQINLASQILTVSAALPLLKQSEHPRVVLMSSITGPVTGFPGWSHYGATKAGQLGFMRTAALELAPWGITVNAIAPGSVATEGLADMGQDYLEAAAATIPLGRLASTSDIADAVFFLASDSAGYITGQCITVDGGQTLPETAEAVLPLASKD